MYGLYTLTLPFARPKRLLSLCEVYESGNNPPLRLDSQWQDVILDPAVLDLFFTLYWKVRNNPQLAHHAVNCLGQLASLHGKILSTDQIKLEYLTNYLQRFLKLIACIDINDQEAIGITNIVRKLQAYYNSYMSSLSQDFLKSFVEQLTRLTCMFIEGAAREESVCSVIISLPLCLYITAFFISITN